MIVRRLEVWRDEEHIASLEALRPWKLRCRYDPSVVAERRANQPLLSCSLPITSRAQDASAWARGLLPEGNHLLALASRARVPTNYTADMLARYGRDIAGAFSISVGDPEPRRWATEPYTPEELAVELRSVADAPGFAVRDDSELSIAGLQNKLLVVSQPDGSWARPVNGHPSTHIIKLDDPRRPGVIAAEHACLLIARRIALTSVQAVHTAIDGMAALIVDRYDRAVHDAGQPIRLHQEDTCQALGIDIDAAGGRGKYEQFGGPSYRSIARLLDRHADAPDEQLVQLLRIATFTAVIGNADAHGKNISVLIDTTTGAIRLAPLYDTVPTALWPSLRATSAMSVGGRFAALATVSDLIAEAHSWGLAATAAGGIVMDTLTEIVDAIETPDSEHAAEVAALVHRRRTAMLRGREDLGP